MTFLTVVERELRVASRRVGTFRVRAYVALVASTITAAAIVFDVLAIGWVGMWMGLTQKSPHVAFGKTLLSSRCLLWDFGGRSR